MNSRPDESRAPLVKWTARILVPAMLMYSTSCSLVSARTQRLTVSSTPDGAEVFVNGELVGTTPVQTKINRRDDSNIMIRKEGYKTITKTTSRELSGVGIVDVIFGCIWLVPFLGLLGDGAYKQDPKNVSVILPQAS
ncbi:PEGA domain-containing protein [Candidatus Sumerlaeota bacterium]|nr:PEGA domain-containing protein [Candidatus Sumerlaeota bacterium]